MRNNLDVNLVGTPNNYQLVVGSGAGGDVTLNLTVPAGQLWIVKFATAYHADGTARVIVWNLYDPATFTVQVHFSAAVGSGVRVPLQNAMLHFPLVCTPGGFTIQAIVSGASAAINCTMEAHVHKVYGVGTLT